MNFSNLTRQFKRQRVLVIGDVVLDHYVRGSVERLNPEAPVPLLDATHEHDSSGGAGNVAKNAAMLGAQTTLVSVVGTDRTATQLLAVASKENYQPEFLTDPSRPTIRKMRLLAGSQQLLRVDFEKRADISATLEDKLLARAAAVLQQGCNGLIISDYAKGVITPRVGQRLNELAHEHNIPIAADVKPSRAPFIKGATFISPNLKEGRQFIGLEAHDESLSFEQLARKLHDTFQTAVCLTLGSDGVYVYSNDEQAHIPQQHVREVFDVSGAGDTAVTVLLLARLSGATYQEAAQLANAAGAVVIGKVGTVGLTTDELLQMISHKHE